MENRIYELLLQANSTVLNQIWKKYYEIIEFFNFYIQTKKTIKITTPKILWKQENNVLEFKQVLKNIDLCLSLLIVEKVLLFLFIFTFTYIFSFTYIRIETK